MSNKKKYKSKKMTPKNKEISQLEALNYFIENVDKGISGYWTDFDGDGCGNIELLKHFKPDITPYSDFDIKHEKCQFDEKILFPKNKIKNSSGGCFYHCGINFVKNAPIELQKQILERFRSKLIANDFSEPILTEEEYDMIENVINDKKENSLKEYKRAQFLHDKTLKSKRENLIIFYGNNLNYLPENIFTLWDKFACLKEEREDVINSLEKESDYCDYDYYSFSSNKFEYILENDDYDYPYTLSIFPFNSGVAFSLYHDYELDKELFQITLIEPGGTIDIDNFKNAFQIILFADEEITKIYNELKKIREDNSDKYNHPYKISKYLRLKQDVDIVNKLTCETCLIRDQCYGFCIYGEKEVEIPKTEEYKINLHILEPCNYRCKHCFAHFDNHNILPINIWLHIIDNCVNSLFIKEFNIAGGEPLLYKELDILIDYIKYVGADCSIITNGFFMDENWIKKNAKKMKTIGFSIDSFEPETLKEMGRVNSEGEFLSKERFKEICTMIKKENPDCNIKINTVVTSINKDENIADTIIELGLPISRWKIFKMDVFKNDEFDNSAIQVNNEEYDAFIKRNIEEFNSVITNKNISDNKNHSDIYSTSIGLDIVIEKDVNASYIMIDANGFLVDDSINDNYLKIIDCKSENFEDGFNKLSFNRELYFSRYRD